MRASVLFSLLTFASHGLAVPAEKRDEAPKITNPVYYGPIEDSVKEALANSKPPQIVQLDSFSLAEFAPSNQSYPSSHPGTPLTPEEEQMHLNIIGNDDRVEVNTGAYPWSTIGRLVSSSGALCSAALVGPRLVSTARHCIDAAAGTTFQFAPNWRDGPRYGSYGVNLIYYLGVPDYMANNCLRKYDWALLVLDAPAGNNQGWLGSGVWTSFGVEGQAVLNSAAYHGDKGMNTMWYHGGVTSRKWQFQNCDNYGPLQSDTDGTQGSSGSAIWLYDGTNRYNLGALSGGTGDFTIHGWGAEYVNTVIDLNRQFPN